MGPEVLAGFEVLEGALRSLLGIKLFWCLYDISGPLAQFVSDLK